MSAFKSNTAFDWYLCFIQCASYSS